MKQICNDQYYHSNSPNHIQKFKNQLCNCNCRGIGRSKTKFKTKLNSKRKINLAIAIVGASEEAKLNSKPN